MTQIPKLRKPLCAQLNELNCDATGNSTVAASRMLIEQVCSPTSETATYSSGEGTATGRYYPPSREHALDHFSTRSTAHKRNLLRGSLCGSAPGRWTHRDRLECRRGSARELFTRRYRMKAQPFVRYPQQWHEISNGIHCSRARRGGTQRRLRVAGAGY